MKIFKLFLFVVLLICSHNIQSQVVNLTSYISTTPSSYKWLKNDPKVDLLLDLYGRDAKAALTSFSEMTQEQIRVKIRMIEGIKAQLSESADNFNAQTMQPVYSMLGYLSFNDYKSHLDSIAAVTSELREGILSGKTDAEIGTFFETAYENSPVSEYVIVNQGFSSKLMPGGDCRGRCRGAMAANIAVAYGVCMSAGAACLAIIFPPLAAACAAGVGIAYVGSLAGISIAFDNCIDACAPVVQDH